MRYLISASALFLLLVIQNAVFGSFHLASGNLLLLFLVVTILSSDLGLSLFVAVCGGLFLDFASGTVDGTMLLCMLAVSGFTYVFIHRFVPKEHSGLILTALVVLNTIVFTAVFIATNRVFAAMNLDSAVDWKYFLGSKLLKDLAVNLIFFYPIYWLYSVLVRKLVFAR